MNDLETHHRTHSGKVAVIGCGYWGKNLVRNFFELGALGAICDSNTTALRTQAEKYPNVWSTTDLGEVLASKDIQALVVASPAARHFAHATAALDAGMDVFIEKPLALNYRDGLTLVERAKAEGRILMVGHVLEYHSAIETLKSLVADGELGEIRYLYSSRLNLGKVRKEENILWSFAPHDISIITSLVGTGPSSVSASGGTYLQHGVPDVTVTNMVFAGDIRAHIFVSWLHPYKEQQLTVIGTRKMAVFDDTLPDGKLRILDSGIDFEDGIPVTRQNAATSPDIERSEPLLRECEHFLHCLKSRDEPLTGGESALRVLKVLEACQLSLDLGGIPIALTQLSEGVPVG